MRGCAANMPDISLCMIVRDEERSIGRCLESAARIADEMIIVDTGSRDHTRKICGEFGARLFDFKWTHNFAAARNFGLEKASCGWILWLDADEELQVYDLPALKAFLRDYQKDLAPVRMLHFYGPVPADAQRSHVCSAFRLFRNGAGIRFTGKIHERLVPGADEPVPPMEATRLLRILHYGYMDDELENKNYRNIDLLLREREALPGDAWLDYHLAAEYYRLADYEKACQFVNTAIIRFLKKGILPPSLSYKLKYDILVATGNFTAAYPGIEKAIELYPDYVDLHFYKGLIQFEAGEYEKAGLTFQHCLILGEGNPEYLILSGSGGFLSLYHLGLCYEKLHKHEQAAEAYRQAVLLSPDFEPAGQRLEALCGKSSK